MTNAEQQRVESFGHPEDGLSEATPWYHWGPYLSERAWGTVREDYSEFGEAWDYFPHDHARSRTYRWGEDGMGGISDVDQRLCMALALWNGRDPILKERMFGLTGPQGNHGEDVKEYWWYLDALPSHSWLHWRYHYPQGEFPYGDLVAENGRRGQDQPEYELLDTGAFDDDRYWVVEVHHGKADPHDLLMRIEITNAGPDTETLHVLPHLWFRNTWDWADGGDHPTLAATTDDSVAVEHPMFGALEWVVDSGPDGAPELLFCDNDTNLARLFDSHTTPPYPKDGINDHVVDGAPTVNPDRAGTKCSAWYRVEVPAGETRVVRVRLRPPTDAPAFDDFDAVMDARREEADEFYAGVIPDDVSADEASVARQAFAGMIWGKQYYSYDVRRWLEGDPLQPTPPAARRHGRNSRWEHLDARDIMSMPDPWEYPWFAAWDLAFHTVALAHVDPAFAKYQLLALGREWFQHSDGALPAYEWAFDDVNPPVHAWAALQVFDIDGRRDHDFLARLLPKLLVNFTWWVNRQDAEGDHMFSGGFLGLDNISAIDRSHLPTEGRLKQADGTSWMAFYALCLLQMSMELAERDDVWTDIALKFIEHYALIVDAMHSQDLWDDEDGFFYDVFHTPDGIDIPIKVRSIVGVLPLMASVVVGPSVLGPAGKMQKRFAQFLERYDHDAHVERGQLVPGTDGDRLLIGVIPPGDSRRVLNRVFDEDEFLSPYGLRALSRYHRDHPVQLDLGGVMASCGLRAGGVDHRHVRWQLELAGSGVDAGQRPAGPRTAAVRQHAGRRLHVRVPDGERPHRDPVGVCGRPAPTAHLPVPAGRGRPAAVLRPGRQTAERSTLARQHPVQRVLPRRRRSRVGRLAPDGVDGPGGRPDRASRPVHGASAVSISFGRQVCGSLDESSAREWLVTDGLGGYACGTVSGLRTRRYHGLLMVPTATAGAARMLGLAGLDVVVVVGDRRHRLATHEWADGTVDPTGHRLMSSFDLEDGVPRWRYDLGAVQVEVEVAMTHGRTEVGIVHRLLAGSARLEVTPLCTWRDQHGDRFAAADPDVGRTADGFEFEGAYRVRSGSDWEPGGAWYRGDRHREEAERGLGDTEDLWAAGRFTADLHAGDVLSITATASSSAADSDAEDDAVDAVAVVGAARARAALVARWAGASDEVGRGPVRRRRPVRGRR